MKFAKASIGVVTLIGVLLFNAACADSGSQKQTLPRSFGPIALTMGIEDFTKLTKVTPEICPHCADNESIAGLYIDDHPGLFPKSDVSWFSKLFGSRNSGGIEFDFYKGKLYKIEMPREKRKIDVVKKEYVEKYGPITNVDNWKNGVSWLIWENETTALAVAYIREKTDSFSFYESVGDVIGIQYLDKPLRTALETQEKEHPSRPHH